MLPIRQLVLNHGVVGLAIFNAAGSRFPASNQARLVKKWSMYISHKINLVSKNKIQQHSKPKSIKYDRNI